MGIPILIRLNPYIEDIFTLRLTPPLQGSGIDMDITNYANPVYGVATSFRQVHCLRWGYPSLFYTATSLLIWYKMFYMRDISYRLIWMKFINMLSVYAQSGTHWRFNWWIAAVLT